MKPDNVGEERSRDGGRRVGVAACYEVGVLREAVDPREYDSIAVHLGEPFNEVQRNVSPNLQGNIKGLEMTGGMERLHLVPQEGVTGVHEVTHEHAIAVHHEVMVEALQRLLDTFMSRHVCELEYQLQDP